MNMQFSTEDAIQGDIAENISNIKSTNKIRKNIYKVFKRIIDILVGILGIIILIPLTIIIFIINVFQKDMGPVFYSHMRMGKGGKHFKLYKFRTMVVGADDILSKYLAENEEARKEFKEFHKLDKDPRITKFGKFLRKSSLDEIPQFINVLKGDMSLIGPRPIVDDEVEKFGDKMKTVHSVKPGITGYWAANGRSNTSYKERVEMENYYAENCSFLLDLKIFFQTIVQVLKKEGAK